MRVMVVVSCVSVTKLTATYLIYESKVRLYKVSYNISNACIVWISLKTLCSLLASLADAKVLDFSLSNTRPSICM